MTPEVKEQQPLNLFQKLAKIRKAVEVMKKDKSGYGYKYLSEEAILAKITTFMDKYEVSLIPEIKPGTTEIKQVELHKTKFTKDGQKYDEISNETLIDSEMSFAWVDNTNPEDKIVVPWIMVGQRADASQCLGTALTYAKRYFLTVFFNIARSDDDPDQFRKKQKEAEAEADKAVRDGIIANIDTKIREICADKPESKKPLKEIVSKFVKDGDYRKIKETALAAKLLSDINEFEKGGNQ